MSLSSHDIETRIRKIQSLPTLPDVVNKLSLLVETDKASAAEIAKIISEDQVLTAKVLKVVNSSFYGFPGRIGTINHALVLLGFNVMKGIILTVSIVDAMSSSLVGLWEHSLGVAAASEEIARHAKLDQPVEISTAGLLHDLGKVVLCVEMSDVAEQIMEDVEASKISFIEAEKKALDGLTHCDLAGWLAKEWNLPARLKEPICFHHEPQRAETAQQATAAVHLADFFVRALQYGSGGDPFVPRIDPAALDILGLNLTDLPPLLERIEDQLEGIDTREFAS
ncbi:HDOD domain-containing protein [Candidatus Sumerlaeota bacterium]|nr:HDOD domain-containing protein [Candidatus Sumerlaeota bacterium]